MYRKIAIIVIVMVLMFSLVSLPTAYADTISNAGGSDTLSEEDREYLEAMREYEVQQERQAQQDQSANTLKDLGLFMGTNNGFELDRAPTRTEAIVLLLRMLGKEQEAKNSNYTHPFTDVPAWADKYIAYAYNKGLTNGYSSTVFGGSDDATPEQFCALTLRALEYNEKDGDFVYKESIKKAEEMGLAAAGKYKVGAKNFTRGDCAGIIYKALAVVKKTEGVTLAESLVKSGFIDAKKAESYGLYSANEKIRVPLRKDAKTGEMTLFLADVIKQVPGAKYGTISGYGGTTPELDDYESAFAPGSYDDLLSLKKSANLIDRFTNNRTSLSVYPRKKDVQAVAIYDDSISTMIAASLDTIENISKNGYMDFVVVNIDIKAMLGKAETEFEELFGNPIEVPNAITTIEKAKLHIISIDNETGKTIRDVVATNYSYRLVIDSNKYPDLAKKTVNFNDFTIPPGMTALEAIKKDLKNTMRASYFNGSFVGPNPADGYVVYNNQWTQRASDWNNPRYVVFDDGNKPIAYTTIYPSQLKVVDVGQVKAEVYIDTEAKGDDIVKVVYTKE